MNVRVPTLRKISDGRFVTKWGGRYHYFGRDPAVAVKLYAENLQAWKEWRDRRAAAMAAPPKTTLKIIDIAERFIGAKEREKGLDLGDYYRKHLKRFLAFWAALPAPDVRIAHLQALKDDMLAAKKTIENDVGDQVEVPRFKPKTINHDVIAIKAMMQWAIEQELIQPVNLRGCKAIKLRPPPNKAIDVEIVRRLIRGAPETIRPWLAVNYLTLARPIEVVRIVRGECEWTEPGVCRVESKNDFRSAMPRHVVFSEIALAWLKCCRPLWSRLDSYSSAVRRVECLEPLHGPHRLRHSGATHLIQEGVPRADVDLILGHLPTRVSMTYARIHWQPLREITARLTLGCGPQ